jgi:ketosteroid isomerase-like protein
MDSSNDVLVERRSGLDRRADGTLRGDRRGDGSERRSDPADPAGDGTGLATIDRWPLEVDPSFEGIHPRDPWASVVHRSVADYRAGRLDSARQAWDERIIWRVDGGVPAIGPEGVFAHHRQLATLTDDTFRQKLASIEASGGPIVEAHVRTSAERHGRRLDIPTLIVFELAAMRIRQVTEIPGDLAAWEAFWTD